MTAIILAGGKSSRMRTDKAFIEIDNQPLIKRQTKLLKQIFKKIIIVTNSPNKYKFKGIKIVQDIIPDHGPLGGIYSGLSASKSFYNFVLACDMPFINLELIKYMYKNRVGYDAVIPKINNRYEPLFAIYSKNCLEIIKESVDKKNFKIIKIFPKIKLKVISKKEVLKFGLPQRLFANINTPKDLNLIHSYRQKKGFSYAE